MSAEPRTRQPKQNLPEYEKALDNGEHFCAGNPAPYTDYADPPSAEEAEELCLPCPMYSICRKNAEWRKWKWGIYGGIVWLDGRPAHLMSDDEVQAALADKD